MDSRATESEILELENKLLHPTAGPISVPLYYLKLITRDFCIERELGRGGYGVVYKGILRCGSVIAVKKFNEIILAGDHPSFENEASFLMDLKHQNIIQLLGYCAESKGVMIKQPTRKVIVAEAQTRMLCFEYMCNGGLDKHLSDESSGLEWNTRYKIIRGICSGLKYLHGRNIIHLDLKPQNILMDTTMVPKFADFGLSRFLSEQKSKTVSSNCRGTTGYMAPEYIDRGIISKKADIFSLGVIIIEILKGCRDDYPDHRQSTEADFQHFTEKVLSNWRNRFERSSKYTSPELHTQLVKQCIHIALECVHPDKEKRPDVSNIIEDLNVAEESCCVQNGKDLLVEHQMGAQEGVLQLDVLHEDSLVALNKIPMKDHGLAWITKDTTKSAVAPLQPQHGPVLASVDGSFSALRHQGARNASFWVAHKALASLEDNMLKDWAATINLGPSVEALEQELKSVKVILEFSLGKVIHNLALESILMELRELVYDSEDVLDEMEYFRIQGNMLDVSRHVEGYAHNLDLNVLPSVHDEPPELRFDRDNASQRIQYILEKMQLMQQKVSSAIKLLGSDWSTVPNIAQSRPVTTSQSIEKKLYGRDLLMNNIIHDITKGKHSTEILTVIPIVGPGGIGKTTLAQHIYHSPDVQDRFNVRVWTCISLNFNVNKLIEEIQGYIPKIDGESSNGNAGELIRQRLENKRLLLVLDDIWDCSDEDEWKRLLVPFQKSQVQGNIIIVTTRFPAQAQIVVRKNNQPIYLKGLENKEFEELFLEVIFGDDDQSRKDHTSLLETGFKIAGRLKGSPLAAKTVGRLLKTELDLAHWTRILESKEWEHSSGKNDIMPALKLSFDHLPSQLQQCFSFCALFPQDYRFKREELVNFWIGQEVLHSLHGQNKRVEDIGRSHLTELLNYGFLENKVNEDGQTFYIVHDLLHELARKVSSLECLNIESSQSQVSTLEVLPSIRHLSINIDDTSAKDRLTLKNSVEDFKTLGTRLKVEKLRTLMIFGEHHGCFVKAFGDLFRETKALRVIFLSSTSYNVEDLLHNFYQLVHLRYLRIGGSSRYRTRFPNKLSRFYHVMVLHAHHYAYIDVLPRGMSNLGKLRHFHVEDDSTHSSIVEVGKLKSLQELRRFVVKQEDKGFELREIGHLVHLCGSLSIYNLENVRVKEEVDEAKLLQKSRLQELTLHWDNIDRSPIDYTLEEYVLERLKPNNNLLKLSIKGHRGTTCPSWLGTNLSFKSLESLCLDGVAWKTYPPIGDLWTVNRLGTSDNIPNIRFENLRRLELVNLPWLKRWVVHAPCQLFRFLEVLIISGCSQLEVLSFQHLACCQQRKEPNVNSFPRLLELQIEDCPQLLSFPPIPWNKALCTISIERIGSSCLDELVCGETNFSREYYLEIEGKYTNYFDFFDERKKDTVHSKIWNVLDFHNLTGLNTLRMERCQFPPLSCLQILSSLRTLQMSCLSNAFPFVEADSHVKYQFPVEQLSFKEWNASGKELTQLLTYFPRLSDMHLWAATKITGLSVTGQQATEITAPLCSANNVDPTAEDETVASEEAERGLLLLPPQLQELWIGWCPDLSLLRSNPHDDSNEEDGGTGGRGGGLQGLTSLRRLRIWGCPKLLSAYTSYSSFSSSFPFPNSLEHLEIKGAVGTEVLLPLSNLTSLTSLDISSCGDLRGEGLLPLSNLTSLTSLILSRCGDLRGEGLLSLLAQGHLTKLSVIQTPNFFVDSDPSQVHEKEIPSCSSKLQELYIDDVAGFTAAAIHRSLIFSSLTKLDIQFDGELWRFTEQQEALLFVDSLECIRFVGCSNLQSLPERLHTLHNLKRLYIRYCEAIQMLPKDGLPSSLEELDINNCLELQSLPKDCLPDSLRKLTIEDCPAIRSLPEVDDLPSSLGELYVSDSRSEELRRQCRKLINIIPIVNA